MTRKYTILKALTQNSNKGFTLLELIVGMMITLIVGGLAMDAFVNASGMFSKDKKTIDSSQNLSAILEIIGNDIRQSGEQIGNTNFPVIEVVQNTTPIDSSTITIRRAVTRPLTLCEPVSTAPGDGKLIVADATQITADRNCDPALLQPSAEPLPILPIALREARNYRCKVDDPNSTTGTDACEPNTQEKVQAVIYDSGSNYRAFNYVGDVEPVAPDTTFRIETEGLGSQTSISAVGSPIYLIEERTYTLDNEGTLKMSVNGGSPDTLIKGIAKFKVSARLYSDTTTKKPNSAPANACDSPNGSYACKFNRTTTPYNWKNIAGIKIELQAKYDNTGQTAKTTSADKAKLSAEAEFFPRNVLSK